MIEARPISPVRGQVDVNTETACGGLFVALIGPDGSGKTTVAQGIATHWQQMAVPGKEPEYIHGGFGLVPRLRILRQIWARLRGRQLPPEPDYTKKHAGAKAVPHSLPRSLLYLAYYYWDYLLGHILVHRVKSQDRIIIADRYFYDYFFQRGNMHLPHGLLRLLCRFVPQPDLVVVLDADPEIIYERKDELTVVEIERQQGIIRQLSQWLSNTIVVDTARDVESTVSVICTAMAEKVAGRER